MEVHHGKIAIELIEGERVFLKIALCLACELANEAVRHRKVSDILIRAGVDPDFPSDIGRFRDFVDELHEKLRG